MAHKRGANYKPTTTISIEQFLLERIDDYRFAKRKENRSAAIADLVMKGLKYVELVEKKKRERMLG
jgi:metal-responsive CopG/Arc/MetJ family transcriptional regulator